MCSGCEEEQGQQVQRQVEPEEEEETVAPKMIQRQAEEEDEEETVASKLIQRQAEPEEEEKEKMQPLQGKFATSETQAQILDDAGEAANRTAMPSRLKAGMEVLSGMDLSGIRVHTNSSKPAQFNALAYTQGQDIYVGPGQEKHLPHEGWHAVQQMQGRVNPTAQCKGVSINDDDAMEREADAMGAQALQMQGSGQSTADESGVSSGRGTKGTISTIGTSSRVAQFALPAIAAAFGGASEWIAAGALGYSILGDVSRAGTSDVKYSWQKVDGVLVPNGGNDVGKHKKANPNSKRYEARHVVAVYVDNKMGRALGLKFRITFIFDEAGAVGNISLGIISVYDAVGFGGTIDVSIVPRSLIGGNATFRFTVNVTSDNIFIFPSTDGEIQFILSGGNGDLSLSFNPIDYVKYKIG
ncbi:MAG: DUF4157 domain-containing protein [Candidatus Marinimicrobia bacterium]|nr:DUF4157 domain-containing protein [Candidatus Neomarinimicrobiota bacterium]